MKTSSHRTRKQHRLLDTPEQPVYSGSSQEEVKGNNRWLDGPTGLKWMDVWKEKADRYRKEARAQTWEGWVEKNAELVKEFTKHKINYFQAIYPPFFQLYNEFVWVLTAKQATVETVRDYERWWKRYQQPVR